MDVSAAELADYFGLTPRRVHQLTKDGLPFQASGKKKLFNLKACVVWYISHVKTAKHDQGYDAERTRLIKEQADRQEMDNAVKRGELIEIEKVEQAMMHAGGLFSSGLDALSGRFSVELAGESDPAKIQTTIHEEMRRVLDATCAALQTADFMAEDDSDGNQAASEDGGEVGGQPPDTAKRERGTRAVEVEQNPVL